MTRSRFYLRHCLLLAKFKFRILAAKKNCLEFLLDYLLNANLNRNTFIYSNLGNPAFHQIYLDMRAFWGWG